MKKKKLNIFFLSWEDTGVGLYRIIQPANEISKQKLANVKHPEFHGDKSVELNAKAILNAVQTNGEAHKLFTDSADWADIIYSTKPYQMEQLMVLGMMRDFGKCKLVIDTDDTATHVNSDSPAYAAYAMDNPNSVRNVITRALTEADAITCSVQPLKDEIQNELKLKKPIYINPNGIDFRNFFNVKLKKKKKRKVRIGFTGAAGHQYDLQLLERVIPKLKGNFEFVVVGQEYNHSFITKNNGFCKLTKYPEKVAEMDFDIGVAPLRDNYYNRCKSNLRVIEYSALQIPTVCSNIVTYQTPQNTIKCSEPGEWIYHLERLIESSEERRVLGLKAYEEVKEKFNVQKQVKPLIQFLEGL